MRIGIIRSGQVMPGQAQPLAQRLFSVPNATEANRGAGAFTQSLSGLSSPSPITPAAENGGVTAPREIGAPNLGDQIKNAINHVNDLQSTANDLTERAVSGDTEDVHKAVVAMEHALLALDFTLQVRNKVLDAYQEVMRTQV